MRGWGRRQWGEGEKRERAVTCQPAHVPTEHGQVVRAALMLISSEMRNEAALARRPINGKTTPSSRLMK